MRHKLVGNWKKGLAVDLHTLASTYLGPDEFGHDRFENTRSEIGELVYKLKYKSDQSALPEIIRLLKSIRGVDEFDFIIPVPSSKVRKNQPVELIAEELGKDRGVPTLTGYLRKSTSGTELKGISDPEERKNALKENILIAGSRDISGKTILLVDDLYRSGETLNACCDVLYQQAGVKSISVLTMTKTRSNR